MSSLLRGPRQTSALRNLSFLTGKIGVLQALVQRIMRTCGLVIYYGLYTLKAFFAYRVLIDLGKGFGGIYLNLDRRCTVDSVTDS